MNNPIGLRGGAGSSTARPAPELPSVPWPMQPVLVTEPELLCLVTVTAAGGVPVMSVEE